LTLDEVPKKVTNAAGGWWVVSRAAGQAEPFASATEESRIMHRPGAALAAALAFAAVALPAAPVFAATANTTTTIQTTVAATCSVTATNMTLAAYTGAQLDGTATITVTCPSGTAYTITLDQGLYGTSVTTRQLGNALGPSRLNYGLFTNVARTANWGDLPANGVAGTGTGSGQAVVIYGRVVAAQTVPAGTYTDTVSIIVTY
jgi:spore coat protein U-like protein